MVLYCKDLIGYSQSTGLEAKGFTVIRVHVADERVFEATNSAAISPPLILGLLLISVTLNGGSVEGKRRCGPCLTFLYELALTSLLAEYPNESFRTVASEATDMLYTCAVVFTHVKIAFSFNCKGK